MVIVQLKAIGSIRIPQLSCRRLEVLRFLAALILEAPGFRVCVTLGVTLGDSGFFASQDGRTRAFHQWEFQDPKMEVLSHNFWPYFVVIFPYIGHSKMEETGYLGLTQLE